VTEDNESSTHIANVARRSTFSKAMNTRLSVSKASRQSIEESQNDDDYEVLNTTNSGFSDSIWDGLYMHLFEKEDKVIFTEFMPQAFRKVRLSAGISDADYIKSFSSTIKERVAEGGASGAFFFYSLGELFIAKSCTEEESANIQRTANEYADYLCNNKNSYISKIYGSYRLRIYSTSLYFFVMNNIFVNSDKPESTIQEKYDIKGSWVARNSAPPPEGKMTFCTFCDMRYKYTRKRLRRKHRRLGGRSINSEDNSSPDGKGGQVATQQTNPLQNSFVRKMSFTQASATESTYEDSEYSVCPRTITGHHEPNIILKDNDLKYKIRLPNHIAIELYEQLKSDAGFLLSVGVMDYSLLVGVHNTEYDVELQHKQQEDKALDVPKADEAKPRPNRRSSVVSSANNTRNTIQSDIFSKQAFLSNAPNDSNSSKDASEPDADKKVNANHIYCHKLVGPESYCMGIIDYQQQWTLEKKMERLYKTKILGADPNGLSAIEPQTYHDRFISHIESILDIQLQESGIGNPSNLRLSGSASLDAAHITRKGNLDNV